MTSLQRLLAPLLISLSLLMAIPCQTHAQLGIIGELAKRIIMAIDLRIQRLQTRTIYLQNAEKEIENQMQQTELSEISTWLLQLRDLYAEYYQELWMVKSVFLNFDKTAGIIKKQAALISLWKSSYTAVRQDPHFSSDQLDQLSGIYSGILDQSIGVIDQLFLIIQSFQTQMNDAGRLQLIDQLAEKIDHNYQELTTLTQHNLLYSLEHTKDKQERATLKYLYGIP